MTETKDPDRVALRLPPDVRRRVRLLAAIEGRTVNALLATLIARELPTDAELAAQVAPAEGGTDDQR